MNYVNGSELAGKKFIRLENGDLREVKEKFFPMLKECYYYLNSFGEIEIAMNHETIHDKWILKHQPVFRTKEDCEDYRQFLEMLDKYTFDPDWDNDDQERWAICFNHEYNKLYFNDCCSVQCQGDYFESKEKAEEFIEAVSQDRVKRYMFDVWE